MLNKLIVLEGTDGAGKSTQTEKVKEFLSQNSLKYEFFHFPMYGHNNASEVIAKFLRGDLGNIDEVDPYFIGNIYGMDRFLFKPELEKAISENDVVILDRYVFSNLAYQGAKGKKEDQEKIKTWIYNFEFKFLKLPYPDLSIFFDVPMDIVKERLESKREGSDRDYLQGKKDIHETDLEFQSRVRDNYLSLVGSSNYKIIPCAKDQIVDGKKIYTRVFKPDELFESYRDLLNHTLFNTPYNA
jgi:dTMP kinase